MGWEVDTAATVGLVHGAVVVAVEVVHTGCVVVVMEDGLHTGEDGYILVDHRIIFVPVIIPMPSIFDLWKF